MRNERRIQFRGGERSSRLAIKPTPCRQERSMMRLGVLMCAALCTLPTLAAEDFRVMKLEQDVREVRALAQRTHVAAPSVELPRTERDSAIDTEATWLKAASWNRIRAGMDELAVIEILGKPTAVRPIEPERRALLYTLEIGTTGFLTGSVVFENGRVVEVQRPTLR
jgi:hypothetical protein